MVFGLQNTSLAHIWVFASRSSQLFTVCQNLFPFTRYISPKLECFCQEFHVFPLLSYLKNHTQNEHKMINCLPIFGNKSCFYVFSHVTRWVRKDYVKKFWKKCRISIFIPKFGSAIFLKIREFPYILANFRH